MPFDSFSSTSRPSVAPEPTTASTSRQHEERSDPARNFLDLNPTMMLAHFWSGGVASRNLRPQFYLDARLRTFARALQVLCMELDKPGTIFWAGCEPIASYHVLIGRANTDHNALVEMYYRIRGVLRARAKLVAGRCERMNHGGEPAKDITVLERQLWNARDDIVGVLHSAKASDIVRFLRSCAHDIRHEPLPPLPLRRPSVYTDPDQVAGLVALYSGVDPSRPLRPFFLELDESCLESMIDSDDGD